MTCKYAVVCLVQRLLDEHKDVSYLHLWGYLVWQNGTFRTITVEDIMRNINVNSFEIQEGCRFKIFFLSIPLATIKFGKAEPFDNFAEGIMRNISVKLF